MQGKTFKPMSNTAQQKAVIYCRIASYKHTEKGCALNSQEKHCREFAKSKGYEIAKVFYDEGISGDKKDRSGMNTLLGFLDKNKMKR